MLPATLYLAILLPAITSIISTGTLCLISYFCGIRAWNVCVPSSPHFTVKLPVEITERGMNKLLSLPLVFQFP